MIIRGGAPDFSRREQAANWRLLDDASKPFIQAASAFVKSRIILFAFQVIKYSAHRVNCIVRSENYAQSGAKQVMQF